MKKIVHTAESRGGAEHGWLSSKHTFSFAEYQNPDRMRFGLLRVINDDVVQPSKGFGTHPHENMEIVSIPIHGELRHADSMGNEQFIKEGEVQIMSAGTGLTHSEFNASDANPVSFLQIWIFPKERDIDPRYDQKLFPPEGQTNRLQNIVSPNPQGEGVWINQDAWFWLGSFDDGLSFSYTVKTENNGIYLFVIEGNVTAAGEQLHRRDGLAIEGVESLDVTVGTSAKLLIMDVPL
jgi:redox-sensitive bicupin YhaK (pirin superfamily)